MIYIYIFHLVSHILYWKLYHLGTFNEEQTLNALPSKHKYIPQAKELFRCICLFQQMFLNMHFKIGPFLAFFLHFHLFNGCKEIGTSSVSNIPDYWIKTADLWCRKWPLCHRYCPSLNFLVLPAADLKT